MDSPYLWDQIAKQQYAERVCVADHARLVRQIERAADEPCAAANAKRNNSQWRLMTRLVRRLELISSLRKGRTA